jgi:hypothetical protein
MNNARRRDENGCWAKANGEQVTDGWDEEWKTETSCRQALLMVFSFFFLPPLLPFLLYNAKCILTNRMILSLSLFVLKGAPHTYIYAQSNYRFEPIHSSLDSFTKCSYALPKLYARHVRRLIRSLFPKDDGRQFPHRLI